MDTNFYKEYDKEVGDKLLYLDSELHYQVAKSLTIGKTYDCIEKERTLTG